MRSLGFASALALAASVAAHAQTDDFASEADLLIADELPSVVTASRYAQPISEAPSAVTVVTANEIRMHGHRMLGEILANSTGFYTSDDRNYVYAGVRGFGIAGDYNNRILLLVDGHRVNDAVYLGGQIDRSFPVDVSMIERVEIVRGPGSALYGTSAFFAVVNVITKRGRDLRGGRGELTYGSDVTAGGALQYGSKSESGVEFALGVSGLSSDGKRTLYYPEWDDPATSFGIARDADREDEVDALGTLRVGDLTLQVAWGQRDKRIPTASFGTYFGTDRTRTRDSTGWLHAAYERSLGADWLLSSRVYVDRYYYQGIYVYDYSETSIPLLVDNEDISRGNRAGMDVQLSGGWGERQRITFGAETIYNFELFMLNRDLQPTVTYIDEDAATFDWGLFLQDEIDLTERLRLLVGVRHDHTELFGGSTNPRVALLFEAREGTTLKVLYGRAFRAPTFYELRYVSSNYVAPQNLGPERIGTAELVWEQRLSNGIRFVASAFHSSLDDLIALEALPTDEFQFQNRDSATAYGGELTLEGRWGAGWTTRVGLVAQRAEDASGARLANSPRALTTLAVTTPAFFERLQVAFDARYVGNRKTGKGVDAPGAFVPNLTLNVHDVLGVDLSLSARNLFDKRYYDPAGEEHVQARIEQNGLTFLATASAQF